MTKPVDHGFASISGGKSLSELSATLLRAIDPDAIAEEAAGKPGASPDEVAPEKLEAARKKLTDEDCAPFDVPALRDALVKAKQDAEQTIDNVTVDTVLSQGYDPAAKAKAAGLVQAFHDYLAEHQTEIDALQILYNRPYRQRLTEPMLKELEQNLRDNHAAWTLIDGFQLPLSWSHYVRLLQARSAEAQEFYHTEALRGAWSVRQLDRQMITLF
ncbi:MAG TPA: DUF1016 N-terminal domain-containing protein [Verrucomicrobiales bacterium]|nr:DUF1016 N-terminal domain-containing protein [Verrucomicrobiales bacterium]